MSFVNLSKGFGPMNPKDLRLDSAQTFASI